MSFEFSGNKNTLPIKEQQERLDAILAENMRTMVSNHKFFAHLLERHEAIHNRKPSGNDQTLSVMVSGFGRRAESGLWEEGEHLYVGVTSHQSKDVSTSSIVPVAERIEVADGKKLVPLDGFTVEQSEMVANMIDELTLAKLSGQIPDLHTLDLNWLYIPSDYGEPIDD